jgi:hypothetical protein
MVEQRYLVKASELKFKGKKPMGLPRTRWLSQLMEDVKKRGRSWQESEKERLEEKRTD